MSRCQIFGRLYRFYRGCNYGRLAAVKHAWSKSK